MHLYDRARHCDLNPMLCASRVPFIFGFAILAAPTMLTPLDVVGQSRTVTTPRRVHLVCILSVLALLPLALSNHPARAAIGLLLLAGYFFSGYLLVSAVTGLPISLRLVLSPVVGILTLTTVFDVFVRVSSVGYFFCVASLLSAAGLIVFAFRMSRELPIWTEEDNRTMMAGVIVTLSVAPLYWRSGRFSDGKFVFQGPAGQDPLFHVTLLQRLLHHVPPDNFMFSGLIPSVYHYFNDQSLALILRAQDVIRITRTDLFDLYYRCYPTVLYFVLGALAYVVGREVVRSVKGGVLSVLLLLGVGGLGPIVGLLQTCAHATHSAELRERLMTPWTSWDGIDGIRPLVHRPAHYFGLLVTAAAISLLLAPSRTRRHWSLAGLMLGLLAGFNFTLAATFGGAAVLSCLLSFARRRKEQAINLAWLAVFAFIGSLPVNAAMLLSGFHNGAMGFPFEGPNLDLSTSIWGPWLGRILPATFAAVASLILFPLMAYGIKLVGIGALLRADLGQERHRGVAMLFSIAFAISFVVGTFFPYKGVEVGSIFLQPTLYILGLFALTTLAAWLERNRWNWRSIALWAALVTISAQVLLAFNFSSQLSFDQDTTRALEDLRSSARSDEVVAYLPSYIKQKAIWGYPLESTNFAIMALTGLDGYFSSESYSILNAVPGIVDRDPSRIRQEAERMYQQRLTDIESFIKGGMTEEASARLMSDHVRWVVVSEEAKRDIASSAAPWRRTNDVSIYHLGP